jgi:hypothetical protein
MTGTDDRSAGSIGQWALAQGMSPEEAQRIEEIAAALTIDADVAWLEPLLAPSRPAPVIRSAR